MSDPRLKGRVIWILMTARPQNLSPDIRRPGRVGNLIIPVLDPTGDDRTAFIQWVLEDCLETLPEIGSEDWRRINEATLGYSAAQFDALRDELAAELEFLGEGEHGPIRLNTDQVIDIIEEQISADIETARRVQELYALINCTRKSLLPDGEKLVKAQVLKLKEEWAREIHLLQLAT